MILPTNCTRFCNFCNNRFLAFYFFTTPRNSNIICKMQILNERYYKYLEIKYCSLIGDFISMDY